MPKSIDNKTGEFVNFPLDRRTFTFNKQEGVAPGGSVELTDKQVASESVQELIDAGALAVSNGTTVENKTDHYLSFPTDGRVIALRRQVTIEPNGRIVVTNEEAKSESVKALIDAGEISVNSYDDEIDGEGYKVTFDKEACAVNGVTTVSLKATVKPDEGDFSDADKEGWELVFQSKRLSAAAPTWSKSGVATFKVKADVGTLLATFEEKVLLKKDGAVFATAQIAYAPQIVITTNSTEKLITDGPETVTAIKVNGTAIEQGDCKITSSDADVKMVDGAYVITPKVAGRAVFELSDSTGTAGFTITFAEPAAIIGEKYYKTLASAFKAVKSGDTIKLTRDVTEAITFTGSAPRAKGFELTVDLDGHEWAATSTAIAALRVDYGTVTVKGGKVRYGKDYAFVVSHVAGDYESKLILESGEFTGRSSVVQCGLTASSPAKYYGGDLVVKGGTFITVPDEGEKIDENGNWCYTLNMLDMVESKYPGGIYSPSSITVEGGTFEKFDPSNCRAEGAGTNFVADGFASEKDGDNYTVKPL